MRGALIAASISFTSVSVCGMNGMSVVHGYGSRNSARNSDSQRLEKILVRRGIEQAVDIGGNRAYYAPGLDYVIVPPPQAFFETINWYRTGLPKMEHASSHHRRLNQDPRSEE